MGETSWNVTVGHAPEVAGDLVIAVRSPRGPDFVTVMISPHVVEYLPKPVSGPGIIVAGRVAMTPTEETVEFVIRVGAANKVPFAHRYYRYDITLMGIGKTKIAELEGLEVDSYTFFVELVGDAIEEFDQVIRQLVGAASLPDQQRRAAAMLHKGDALFVRNQEADAIAAFGDVIGVYSAVNDPTLREIVARALHGKARCFSQLKRTFEEANTLQELVDRFPAPSGPVERELVAGSLFSLGVRRLLTDPDGAIERWEKVSADFGGDMEPTIRAIAAGARINRATALEQKGDPGALAAYDELVATYGNQADPAATEVTAIALLNRAALLGKARRPLEALASYHEVIWRFGPDQRPNVSISVGLSLFGVGYCFDVLGRELAALRLYGEVVDGFADSPHPQARDLVGKALEAALLLLRKTGDEVGAQKAAEEIVRRFADAPEPALKAMADRYAPPVTASPV